jgi:hypothetical protein
MISAYRAGLAAGSSADHPYKDAEALAQAALNERKRLGVAHTVPEEDFLRGFIDGYRAPVTGSDGLQLFVQQNGYERE